MNPLKQLAGQTAIYGLGTIVPRLLNIILVPFYTRILLDHDYGIITELYAYIAFFLVLLTYGMETTFFRFSKKGQDSKQKQVLSNTIISIFSTSIFFILIIWSLSYQINNFLGYQNHQNLIILAAIIVATDAFTSMLFANLRQINKALRFSFIKISTVVLNLGLNLFFLLLCPEIIKNNPDSFINTFYHPGYEIEYILISNVAASIFSLFLLFPFLIKLEFKVNIPLLKKMLKYTFPLLVIGILGMVNEVGDKIMFKYLIPVPDNIDDISLYKASQLGIYGANFKLAILINLFVQMFRYAFEPFFFSHSKNVDAKKIYADVMKYFVIFCLFIFLGVTLYIDIFKYFIGPDFREGLHIVPLILIAKIFLGIFFNLSIWYKINDLTKYGAIIAVIGAFSTISLNILLVPRYGYEGSAVAHLLVYFIIMTVSYFWGRKHYPIQYDVKKIGIYFLLAIVLFLLSRFIVLNNNMLQLGLNTILICLFALSIFYFEKKDFYKMMQKNE